MKEKTVRIGNRISGLAMITFGSIAMSTDNTALDVGGAIFLIEGLGDLISGETSLFKHKGSKIPFKRKN